MANGHAPLVPPAQGQSAQDTGTIASSAPPNCQFIHHPAVFEMVTVTRERIEALTEGDASLYFGSFGIAVGIAGTAWSAIFTVNDMGDRAFAGFMGVASTMSLLAIIFFVKAMKERRETKKKLDEILPPKPRTISSSWWASFWP